jgi:hypothetical protein
MSNPAARRLVNRAARHRLKLRRRWRRWYPELLTWQVDMLERSYYYQTAAWREGSTAA